MVMRLGELRQLLARFDDDAEIVVSEEYCPDSPDILHLEVNGEEIYNDKHEIIF